MDIKTLFPNNWEKRYGVAVHKTRGAQEDPTPEKIEEAIQAQLDAPDYFLAGFIENLSRVDPSEITDEEMTRLEQTVTVICAAFER